MSLYMLNGVELEIDTGDADFIERYQRALNGIERMKDQIPKTGNVADIMKKECQMMYDFFDTLFVKGTGQKLFGETNNVSLCEETYFQLIDICNDQIKRTTDARADRNRKYAQYAPNRQQRRNTQNKGGKH